MPLLDSATLELHRAKNLLSAVEMSRLCAKGSVIPVILLIACAHFEAHPIEPQKTAAAFAIRRLDDAGLAKFVAGTRVAEGAWPPAEWNLDALSWAAFYFNPSLEVARTDWAVARAAVQTAGARPNPTLSLVPGYSSNAPNEISPWFPLAELDIPIETAGKRGYRIAAAKQRELAARLGVTSTAWQVRAQVRNAWIDFVDAQERVALQTRQATIQADVVESLESRFQAGLISSYELEGARLTLDKQRLASAEAQQQTQEALLALAGTVGVPQQALEVVDIDTEVVIPDDTELTSGALQEEALTHRADILVALADYAASQSDLQLEIAKQYPDIHLGPGYQFDLGLHKWFLSIVLDLPLFNTHKGPIAEARARRQQAAARFVALQAQVIGSIERAVTSYTNSKQRLVDLNALLATARDRRDAVAQRLTLGEADRLELLTAEADLASEQALLWEGQVRAMRAVGALEDAIQKPFADGGRIELREGARASTGEPQ